ncbi:MAG: tripartite tricarboxylate transporter TctB family protein, partial [Verrucomicrobiota bacterium]
PNFPAWMGGIVILFFLICVVFRGRKADASPASDEVWSRGLICFLIVLCYLLVLHYTPLPFALVTAVMITAMGGSFFQWNPKHLVRLGSIGLLIGLGADLLFTRVFTIALP